MDMAAPPDPTRHPRADQFASLLTAYPRIAIVGGSNTGKSTLASLATDRAVIGTDEWLPHRQRHNPKLSWSDISAEVVRVCSELPTFVVEGTRVAHALRKGLVVDAVLILREPLAEQTDGHRSQAQAIETVLADWLAVKPPATVVVT